MVPGSAEKLLVRIIYKHLEQESIQQFNETTVSYGQALAKADHTGSSEAAHLHLQSEVYKEKAWTKIPINCINWDDGKVEEECYKYTIKSENREPEVINVKKK